MAQQTAIDETHDMAAARQQAGAPDRVTGSGSAERARSGRSTPVIVAIATVAAIGGGALMSSVWVGLTSLVFRGEDQVDGVGVAALIFLGLGITLLVMLALYLGVGVRLVFGRPPERGRSVPTLTLLAVPVAILIAVVLFNG